MARSMTRNQFVRLSLGGTGALLLVGCPDDDDDVTVGEETGTTVAPPTDTTADTGTETTGDPATETGEPTTDTTTDATGVDDTGTDDTETVPLCQEVETEVGQPNIGPAHDHTVTVPAADVMLGRAATYMLSMDLGHVHEITVTEDMFALLSQGQQVITETLVDATQHSHLVTITCG